MNTEEKILEMLEKLNGNVDKHGEMLEKLNARMETLEGGQVQMQQDISDLRTIATRVAVTQENVLIPQVRLLAEGHETLLSTLAPKTRTEALEDDVALLKTVIKAMSQRIENLEKAQ